MMKKMKKTKKMKEEDSYGIDYNKYDYYKGEDPKKEEINQCSDCSCPKKYCLNCNRGSGYCLCLKKPIKYTNCKKEVYEESRRALKEKLQKEPRREITREQEIELIDIRNNRKIPLFSPNSINLANFDVNSTNLGISSANRTNMGLVQPIWRL